MKYAAIALLVAVVVWFQEVVPKIVAPAWSNPIVFLGVIVGVAGVVVLSLVLQELAEWARDGGAARAFGLTLWAVPVLAGSWLLEFVNFRFVWLVNLVLLVALLVAALLVAFSEDTAATPTSEHASVTQASW